MPVNDQFAARKSPRLNGFDYSLAGAYFVTLVTKNRARLFGHIENSEMVLNQTGEIAKHMIEALPDRFPGCQVDQWMIMPDHLHLIIVLDESHRQLGTIISHLKGSITRRLNTKVSIWQRSFFDRIIRNETEWANLRSYMAENPRRWAEKTL